MPSAAARPPPAACADIGELYVSYQTISCGNNEVCYTLDETQPGRCVTLRIE